MCHDIHTKFLKTGSGIQKLIGGGGGYTYRHTESKVIS
jgi:hypothetical protein